MEPLPEGSLPLIEDTSCDSFAVNDTDEIDCKNFYNQFENSLQDGLEKGDTTKNGGLASFKHLFCQ